MAIDLLVQRLPHGRDLPLPQPASAHAAGLDLYAALERPLTLGPGERALVPTGLVISLPEGHEGQIRPRSGLALHHGITVLNAPGTIDADYRGEVGVVLVNHSREPFILRHGMRIAQLVVAEVARVALREVASLPATARDAGGFGSTGFGAAPGRDDNEPEGGGSPKP